MDWAGDADGIFRITHHTTSADSSNIATAKHVHDMRGGKERCVKRPSLSTPCSADPAAPAEPTHADLLNLAAAVDGMREVISALCAGLKADGFNDEQARIIVTGVFATIGKGEQP